MTALDPWRRFARAGKVMKMFKPWLAFFLISFPAVGFSTTKEDIRSMLLKPDHGRSFDRYVKRGRTNKSRLIHELKAAGFSHDQHRNGCEYMRGGVALDYPKEVSAFVWLCRDARPGYGARVSFSFL